MLCARECAGYTARIMNDRRDYEVLKQRGRTPTLAVCRKCDVKFITPRELLDVPEEAGSYLANKFDSHRCPLRPERDREDDLRVRIALLGTDYSAEGLRDWPRDKNSSRKST